MDAPRSEAVTAAPAPPLRAHVERYTGYRQEGFPAGTHRGLPGRHLTFIISLHDPVDVEAMPDPRLTPKRYQAFVAGFTEGPATIRHDGTQIGLSLDLTPLGARALLGMPASELAGVCVELEDLLGPAGRIVVERLHEAPGWRERFAILDALLLARLRREAPAPRPEVVATWTRLLASGGGEEIGRIAGDLGWSRRHLTDRFRAEIGLNPKAMGRVVRFEHARTLLRRPERPNLGMVALHAGYYDQAHMNRDFRDLAGCSPGTWLDEEGVTFVQDPEPA